MTTPLALICYEHLLPGSQLVNRLQDLGYRVQTATAARTVAAQAVQEKPLLVMLDLAVMQTDVCAVIRELRAHSEIGHVPIIAFGDSSNAALTSAAMAAGATLVAGRSAVLDQLPQLLEQALRVE